MKILKKLFGKQSEESNKLEIPVDENTLDIDQPMIYTITVDESGDVAFYFQCKDGYEETFGSFLNELLSGVYDEQIIIGMDSVFDKQRFLGIIKGMQNSTIRLEELHRLLTSGETETPVIMPSQVFSEVKKT